MLLIFFWPILSGLSWQRLQPLLSALIGRKSSMLCGICGGAPR
jgi:hypothetical protein